jgi:hypothetical protein
MSDTYVPLISSGTAGPLGRAASPAAVAEGFTGSARQTGGRLSRVGKGYDMMTISALGLNAESVQKFIKESKPSYPQFEAWVKKQPGVKLDKATLYKHNSAIRGYIHDDATRKGILGANGISDESSVNPGAVDLNNLDDWYEFYQSVLK